MLDSYFFVPGDKQKYLDKIDGLRADYIVIDLEDAVAITNKQEALRLVLSLTIEPHHFIRAPFFEDCYTDEELSELIVHFQGRIVIPKIRNLEAVTSIVNLVAGVALKMVLLVENAICFLNLPAILQAYSKNIHGIGFGSHDFCSETGVKHTLEHLAHYKRQLVLYCKAYDVAYLDGVDLDLNDFTQFTDESIFAFEIGASGKFLIHPKQIEALHAVLFMNPLELAKLQMVYDVVKDIPDDQIEVYTIDGKVYEKPHIKRIKHLMYNIQKRKNN